MLGQPYKANSADLERCEAPFTPIELRRHSRPDVLDNIAVIMTGAALPQELGSKGGWKVRRGAAAADAVRRASPLAHTQRE